MKNFFKILTISSKIKSISIYFKVYDNIQLTTRAMKIFAISDIHGNTGALIEAREYIKNSDVVIISGDITEYGSKKEAREILDQIEVYNKNILAVHGNIDKYEVFELLEEKGYSIHGTCRVIDGIAFFGVGGSSPTPMKTPTEYSEEKIMEFLRSGYSSVNGETKVILVSHTPPRGTRDRTYIGLRGGSKSIKKFLKANKIDLCLSGHIHEARGISRLGKSIVANSGCFKKGRYIAVEIGDKIRIKRKRIRLKRNN